MGKRKILFGVATMVLLLSAVVVGLVFHNRQQDEDLRRDAIEVLERNIGQYDDQSIVLYETSKAKAETLAKLYNAQLRITEDGSFAKLTLPEGTTIRDVYAMDKSLKYISEMEADYQVQVSDLALESQNAEKLPMRPQYSMTDKSYELQSYLDYLNMGSVWNSCTGDGVTIAVIDTGIDTDHPEFIGRISEYSYNATEDKVVKDNLLSNGSYDWSIIEDEQGHGTAVTGVLAASMNNGEIVGIAPKVNIIAIKAECDENGTFKRTSDLVFGLYYAIERDVEVVNMSFSVSGGMNPFAMATQLACDSDIICVAAAGNNATAGLCWPAADENVIGVGALGNGWELAWYSNFGENVDLVAPGTTYTCCVGGTYDFVNGTSVAAPIVAGAVALYAQNNGIVTFDEVTEILYASSYDLADLGQDWRYGFGALDISAFVLNARGTITYDMLADELENEKGVFIQGHTLQKMPEPERLYAVFDGWYYDDTFTQEYRYYEDKLYGNQVTLYAKWANENDGIPYTYVTLDDGTVEIRSYTGHRKYITIPEKIDGRIVSSIGDFAFSGQTQLREVTLPSGLTNIGVYAFQNCTQLVSIHIPENVTQIKEGAFESNVRLSTVAFSGTSKLHSIGTFAFKGCSSLEEIELPASLENINGSAFFQATALRSISVQSGNMHLLSRGGVLFDYSGNTLLVFPAARDSDYTLPEDTIYIGDYAFAFAKLKQIQFANIQEVGNYSFAYANLESLTIPDSIMVVGEGAFARNAHLTQLTIGKGLSEIATGVFEGTETLKTVVIPANITQIGTNAFMYSGLERVTFAEGSTLQIIGNAAFMKCHNMSEIDIPASVYEIQNNAFYGDIYITRVGFAANSRLRTIGEYAFAGCYRMQKIELPGSLCTIGVGAFQNSGLTEVTVPANVTSIGYGAFSLCDQLLAVTIEDGNSDYLDVDGVVYTLDNTTIHTYPAAKVETYYILQSGTEIVAPLAFAGAENLSSVELTNELKKIGEYGFSYCSNLHYMHIPDQVLEIGRYAFAYDANLDTITFNETAGLPRISFASFGYCGLTNFTVPASVSTMAQEAFVGCWDLTSITFAANSKLETISAYMFDGCNNLEKITFLPGSALTGIQAHGLEGMSNLEHINFGDSKLSSIDNYAFRFCESLKTLDFPETVTSIGRYAFYCCSNLSQLSVPKAVEYIGSYAFLGTNKLELYFRNESLPLYLDENWDYDVQGYYTGVVAVLENETFKYATLESGSLAILKYLGSETVVDLTIADLGASVTVIGGGAFEDTEVTTVVLPDSVTTIQANAFRYTALNRITVPANVTFIGRNAFAHTDLEAVTFAAGCNLATIEQYAFENTNRLTTITLPASLTTMGTGVFQNSGLQSVTFEDEIQLTEIAPLAFAGTKLTGVVLPDRVTLVEHDAFSNVKTLKTVTFGDNEGMRLMSNAFYYTGLQNLHIPANVTHIGEYCFVGLTELQEFVVDDHNPNYTAIDGLLLNKSARKLITVPAGRTGSLTVPLSVEEIGCGAFEQSKLSEVLFCEEANISALGCRAFFAAEKIAVISVPRSVVVIDYYAFAYCKNLKKVIFHRDSQLKGIYEGSFLGCINLETITIPDSVVEIADFAFYGCNKIAKLPLTDNSQVNGIYDYAFAYTDLSGEFTAPKTLLDIGSYAFMGTKLTKITIPDTNKKLLVIGIGAFQDCEVLEEITLPFVGASFENLQITWFGYIFGAGSADKNITYVPRSLKTVTITEGITTLYGSAFANCTGLETIHLPHSVSVLYDNAFDNTTATYCLTNSIFIPDGLIQDTLFGTGITGDLVLAEGVRYISQYAFSECGKLESITIPNSLEGIGIWAFAECDNLKCVYVSSLEKWLSITFANIGSNPLYCGADLYVGGVLLQDLVIPQSVNSINDYAFYNCNSIKSVTVHNGVASIGNGVFDACEQIESVHITDLKSWCALNFADDYSNPLYHGVDLYMNGSVVRELVIPGDITTICNSAFHGCTSLTKVTLSEGIKSIGTGSFLACSNLRSITIPESVTEIGMGAFSQCSSLVSIAIPKNVTSIAAVTFFGCTSLTEVVIPDHVTSIGSSAFWGCTSLQKVTIGNGVTSIGMSAFSDCTDLQRVTIGNEVTSIGSYAFSDCVGLTSIVIPDAVETIGAYAFQNCTGLNYLKIGSGVTAIVSNCFEGCSNFTTVEIGPNVTRIQNNAFLNCRNLSKIINHSDLNIGFNSQNGGIGFFAKVIVDKNGNYTYAVRNSFETEDHFLFSYNNGSYALNAYLGNEDIVTLPTTINGSSYAIRTFHGATNVIIPEGFTCISAHAFSDNTGLRSVVIPESVTVIEEAAFRNCSALESVTMPRNISAIERYAFVGCSNLTGIDLPVALTFIGDGAFRNCSSLKDVSLPDSVDTIGEYAFYGCSDLTGVTIPETITSISISSFAGCKNLSELTIPSSVTSVGFQAFYGCNSLSEVNIPDSVYQIGNGAFPASAKVIISDTNPYFRMIDGVLYDKTLSRVVYVSQDLSGEVILLNSVTDIHFEAFRDCAKITGITLPEGLTSIGDYAFYGCSALEKVVLPDGLQTVGNNAFQGCSGLHNVDIPESVTDIGNGVFADCSGLMHIDLPDSVRTVGFDAFANCSSLETVCLPDGVTALGSGAFSGCSNLTKIALPDSLTDIAGGLFSGCTSLKEIRLGSNLSRIGVNAFEGCLSLTDIAIPDTVSYIGAYAFQNCNALTSIKIPDSVTDIGWYAFSYCKNLQNVYLSSGITEIQDGVFNECVNLQSINIPDGVQSIGECAFWNCKKLLTVKIPSRLSTIEDNAFHNCSGLCKVVNNSTLELDHGSTDHGCVAEHAAVIVTPDGDIRYADNTYWETEDHFLFQYIQGQYQLLVYLGDSETITLPENILEKPYRINGFKQGKHVIIPATVTEIDDHAFSGNMMQSVTFLGDITGIGTSAFAGCKNLENIDLPDSVAEIGSDAFYGCTSLRQIVLPDNLMQISRNTFAGCSLLKSLSIPASVQAVSADAFDGCEGLRSNPQYYAGGMLVIDGWLLQVDPSVRYLSNSEGIKAVADGAYRGCNLLNAVWGNTALPSNVVTIYINSIDAATSAIDVHESLTIKNVVLGDRIGAGDLQYCRDLFTRFDVTGITIYVEASEEDLRWDDNFPGWSNGNPVLYGDRWHHVLFAEADGQTVLQEVVRNTQIIRHPMYSPSCTATDTYVLLGWDLDGDGIADSVPATTTLDVYATAVVCHAHTHVYGEWHQTVEPDCTNPGARQRYCIGCAHVESEALSATGHKYVAVVTEPTCTEQGYTTHTCAACSDLYVDSYINASGHNYVDDACTNCGEANPQAPAGVTVSGIVTTGADGDAIIELLGGDAVVATATVSGKTGTYALKNVAAGTYTLKVKKLNHVAHEYTVTVGTDTLTQDVTIHLVGDVDGNGKINIGDVAILYAHIKGSNKLTDEYIILCANVNSGKLNIGDVSVLYAHIKGTKKLY